MIVKVNDIGVAMNAHVMRSMRMLRLWLSAGDEIDLWMCDGDL
jgi:translation initiation factor IF-1